MTNFTPGQKLECKTDRDEIERFKIIKVGRKYLYLKSDVYSSDGSWRCTKPLNKTIPKLERI